MSTHEKPPAHESTTDLTGILQKVEADWPVLPSGIWNSSSIHSLSRHLQQLSRRGEQTGHDRLQTLVGEIDEQINDIVESNSPPDDEQIDALNDALQVLKQLIASLQQVTPSAAADTGTIDLVHLPRSHDECEEIEQAVGLQHWKYRSLDNLQDLKETLAGDGAKAVLIDTRFLSELNQNLDLLRAGKRARPALFFISDHFDLETRLQALRAGATQLFSKPIDTESLIAAIRECIDTKARPRDRVLIVEDDESQAAFASNLLRKGKLETLSITDPLGVIDAVGRFQPDLILMDLYMPGADGIELTRLIRDRIESVAIPIVFLSGEDDLEKKLLALQAGADDFLNKPVRPQQLLATVKTRIERARSITKAAIQREQARKSRLPGRRALLSQLDLSREDFKLGQLFHALIVIQLSDDQSDPAQFDSQTADPRIEQAAEALKPLLNGDDYLAGIGYRSLAILLRRSTEQEVERLGELAYDTVSQRLKASTSQQTELGIGLALLDGTTENTFDMLSHAEFAAASACQRGIAGFELYGESLPEEEEAPADSPSHPADQFLLELQKGSVGLREQRFTSQPWREGGAVTYELVPAYVSPGEEENPRQQAVQCGATVEFDHFVFERAIERLGAYTLRGKRVRLLFTQSATVIKDDGYIDFIKDALRRHQIVGTGLLVDLDLPSLAADLKHGRHLIEELAALGIDVALSSFACNETAYKVLAYLRAAAVRPHLSLLQIKAERIQHIAAQIRSLRAEILLPIVQRDDQIALQWLESADCIQADFTQQASGTER